VHCRDETGLKSVCPPNVGRGIMDVRNHGIFKEIYMQIYIHFAAFLASFWGICENIFSSQYFY